MKLIIDIPEENLRVLNKLGPHTLGVYQLAIYNGIPLEKELKKIKTEIESCKGLFYMNDDNTCSPYMNGTLNAVLKIIDKHIKENE